MSAPHVMRSAALVLSKNSNLTTDEVKADLLQSVGKASGLSKLYKEADV